MSAAAGYALAGRRAASALLRWAVGASVVLGLVTAILLALGGPARAQEAAPTIQPGDPPCVRCHAYVSNDVVTTWRSQNHGRNGVGCPVCHNEHDHAFRPNPKAAVCIECHDLKTVHPDLTGALPASRCMQCHTGNVHLLPGQESWFQGGLPLTKLAAPTAPAVGVSPGAARIAAIIVVGAALVFGLVVGLLYVRLARGL